MGLLGLLPRTPDRGRVEVTKVESSTSTITLREPVPVGATVYATFYYNTLVDQAYSVACDTAGASGVGTYSVTNEAGTSLLTPQFGSKSAALATVTVEFPSGSERTPDCRFESPFVTTSFVGPVEEDVTVTFASQDATLAKYTLPGSGPYYMVQNASDQLSINMDNSGAPGDIDLSSVSRAWVVGDEVVYSPDGSNEYEDGVATTNNEVDLMIDGVLIQSRADTGDRTGIVATDFQDIGRYAQSINRAAFGDYADAAGAPRRRRWMRTTSRWPTRRPTLTTTTSAGPSASPAVKGSEATVTFYNGTTNAVVAVWASVVLGAANTSSTTRTRPALKVSTRSVLAHHRRASSNHQLAHRRFVRDHHGHDPRDRDCCFRWCVHVGYRSGNRRADRVAELHRRCCWCPCHRSAGARHGGLRWTAQLQVGPRWG